MPEEVVDVNAQVSDFDDADVLAALEADQTNSEEASVEEGTPETSAEVEEQEIEDLAEEVSQEASEDAKQDAVQKFIEDNYDGDHEKFLASQYESRKAGSAQAKEIVELKEVVYSLMDQQSKEPEYQPIEQDPKIEEYKESIEEFEEDHAGLVKSQSALLARISKLGDEINLTKGKLTHADDDSAREYETRIATIQSTQEALSNTWAEGNGKIEKITRQYNKVKAKLDKAESEQIKFDESEKLSQRTAGIKQAKEAEQYGRDAYTNINQILIASNLVDDKEEAIEEVRAIAFARMNAYTKEHGLEKIPDEQFGPFLKGITEKYVGKLKGTKTKKFTEASKRKAQAAGITPSARATPAKAAKQQGLPQSQNDWEAAGQAAKERGRLEAEAFMRKQRAS